MNWKPKNCYLGSGNHLSVGPVAPTGPVAPVAPAAPALPAGPVGPVAPLPPPTTASDVLAGSKGIDLTRSGDVLRRHRRFSFLLEPKG
jgi:hypothetical protein